MHTLSELAGEKYQKNRKQKGNRTFTHEVRWVVALKKV
jgi:hypothetical protein